jgi:hypothetical protein
MSNEQHESVLEQRWDLGVDATAVSIQRPPRFRISFVCSFLVLPIPLFLFPYLVATSLALLPHPHCRALRMPVHAHKYV